MSFLKIFSLKTEGKLQAVIAVMVLLLTAQGIFGIINIRNTNRLHEQLMKLSNEADYIGNRIYDLHMYVFRFLGTENPEAMEKVKKQINDLGIEISGLMKNNPRFGVLSDAFHKNVEIYKQIITLHYERFQTGKAYKLIYGDGQTNFNTLLSLIEKQEKILRSEMKQLGESCNTRAIWYSIIVSFIGLAAGILGTVYIRRAVIRPIRQVIKGLKDAYAEMAEAAGHVTETSMKLAGASSEHATALEQTSSSLEEMSSMTQKSADNAKAAEQIVRDSVTRIIEADQSVNRLTKTMEEISQASEKTRKIVKTIDEIAFQTNLLALNAAVEAARAGEAGAGFAIVASEVRNLAMRSASAAKDTADIIEKTVKKIEEGAKETGGVNDAFVHMKDNSQKISSLIGEVSAGSNEQAQGVGQITRAVNEMEKVYEHKIQLDLATT